MNKLLLASAVVVPLLAALGALFASARPHVARLLPFLPLPALLAAIVVPSATRVTSSWLIFSGNWSLDTTRSTLLAAMSLVWCVGGWHALTSADTRDRLPSLALPWAAALTGNMWAAVAHDIGGFYGGFALMSFAAYGLIVHRDTADARAAGRLYLVFTVLGEMAILCGLLLASHEGAGDSLEGVKSAISTGAHPELIAALLLVGFGVKCALLGVHFWLPTVYTNAPAPVRVVLGGAMINAGVLGWLATLPIGSSVATSLALPLVIVGLVGALGAALFGVMQARASTVLAYSSISQMGFITVLLGVALAAFGARDELLAAITVFAAHHGLTKSALFVSIDAIESQAKRWPFFAVPALALTGAPLTSGALSKLMMKHAVYDVGWTWLSPWLSVAAIGTTVLMARALWCAMYRSPASDVVVISRATPLVAAASALLVAAAVVWLPKDATGSIGAGGSDALTLLWPIVAGVSVSALLWRRGAGSRETGDTLAVAKGNAASNTVTTVSHGVLPTMFAATRYALRAADAVACTASAALEKSRALALAAVTYASALADPERSEAWLRRHASFSFVLLILVLLIALAVR